MNNDKNEEDNDNSIEHRNYLDDDSDDLDETVEVRMGQDSSSRENSQVALESAKREKATENNGDAQWTGQQVRV